MENAKTILGEITSAVKQNDYLSARKRFGEEADDDALRALIAERYGFRLDGVNLDAIIDLVENGEMNGSFVYRPPVTDERGNIIYARFRVCRVTYEVYLGELYVVEERRHV